MGTFTRPAQLLARQKARFASVQMTQKEALKELAEAGKLDFLSQTVGTLSDKELRKIGHPYARRARVLDIAQLGGRRGFSETETVRTRRGVRRQTTTQVTARGRVRDLPINYQTGELRKGIQLMARNNGTMYELFSNVPHAKFVLAVNGTKYMRPRGLLGPKGLLRIRHKARLAGIVAAVRDAQRKP